MNRTTVLLLFGGELSEHDVSISSARNVIAAIDSDKYDVRLCYIDRHGKWFLIDALDKTIDTKTAPKLIPVFGEQKFITVPSDEELSIDVMLPILHGYGGEDGSIQGIAQALHIPIVGSGVVASALGWDKHATKKIVTAHGVRTAPYVAHHSADESPEFSELTRVLGPTLFVKPTRSGSSVGVSKVATKEELRSAIAEAHKHHNVALIEQAIHGKELEVAVLGTKPDHKVSGVGEIISGETFYSYDDKYASDSSAKVVIPADIDDAKKREIQDTAREIYELLHCSGLARIDFFLGDDETLYFNEINTMPGFTNISMYPKLWQHEGIAYSELIDELITDALHNGTMRAIT